MSQILRHHAGQAGSRAHPLAGPLGCLHWSLFRPARRLHVLGVHVGRGVCVCLSIGEHAYMCSWGSRRHSRSVAGVRIHTHQQTRPGNEARALTFPVLPHACWIGRAPVWQKANGRPPIRELACTLSRQNTAAVDESHQRALCHLYELATAGRVLHSTGRPARPESVMRAEQSSRQQRLQLA